MIKPSSVATERGQCLFTGWWARFTGLIAAITCLLAMACIADQVLVAGWVGPGGGDLGFRTEATLQHPGWSRIDDLAAGGAAKAAGLTPDMFVRFDRSYEAHAHLLAGRSVGLWAAAGKVAAGGVAGAKVRLVNPRHLTLIAQHEPESIHGPYGKFDQAAGIVSGLFCIALGLVVLVRGWGSIAALTLALSLFALELMTRGVPVWANQPWQAYAFVLACALKIDALLGLMLLPAALYYERVGKPAWPWLVFFCASAIGIIPLALLEALELLDEPRYLLIGDRSGVAGFAVLAVNFAVGVYWAWRGWYVAQGADRGRFVALLATRVVMLAMFVPALLLLFVPQPSDELAAALVFGQRLVNTVLVPLALAYAVLRHRIVDLGFVLNRTIVFGSISALLLGCFGLIEWGVEHWLPESWVKASVWIDAGAALLVYLAFHRVHEAVETRVEHVFFRGWHANEAILRRFVASAAHFEDERALARSFADELSRFSGEARVALYRRRDRTHDSILERTAGSWDTAPRTLPVDDPAFALMRAERRAVDLSDTLTDLPGVLALPMLDHGVLSGLVLMDLKGTGALYRPDETDVLGWAAHDVALAMAALHAGQIEAENRLLKAQLARLGSLIGDRLDQCEI